MAMKQLILDGDGFKTEEVEDIEKPDGTVGGNGVWSNELATPITSIIAIVPATLVNKLSSIEQKVDSEVEFGVYIKGHLENGKNLIVEDDIYIPKQEVTGSTIDFQEDEPDPSFNGVCHRHPSGCTGFSSVDATSINRNYEFSLLYVNGDIKIGIINLKCGEYRYQLPLRVTHGYSEDIDISKIIHRRPAMPVYAAPKYIRSGNTVISTSNMKPVSNGMSAYKEFKRLQKKMKKNSLTGFDDEPDRGFLDDDNEPMIPAMFQ